MLCDSVQIRLKIRGFIVRHVVQCLTRKHGNSTYKLKLTSSNLTITLLILILLVYLITLWVKRVQKITRIDDETD